ncbi:MAG: hypothetical protein AB8B50_01525 [Pirellulaceae bacterium]
MNEHRQEIKRDEAKGAGVSDLQWRVDQYVLGCGGAGCESGFDREAFENAMLDDEGLALRVAAAVEDWRQIGEAACGLAAELERAEIDVLPQATIAGVPQEAIAGRGIASFSDEITSPRFQLGALAASVLLLLGSAAFWFPRGVEGDGVSSGLASSAPTAELADSWLALSPQAESAEENEPFSSGLAEALEDDWLSVQAMEGEPAELEDDWMRFGAEVFAEEANRSDA